ncbi:MAG: A/G-specific adenine glycosylase [Siphonobacter aquaeclarae]|nr:A/G-specific adenine glycosylase [Siphonobacter aquaeclarae]
MRLESFAPRLLHWYDEHRRDLPWRSTTDPYRIWLSEIILQQTRVAQGMPYYLKFTETFPTVTDLAAADERDVLRLWQGLGYYSRARNLHATARIVADEYGGAFPDSYAKLVQLKGIGPYTAAAIASFAWKEKVAVVDGNVFRVLSRIFGIATDIATPAAKKEFTELANRLIPADHPDLFNHAIMDFGATQCVPVSPVCLFCPFAGDCEAQATGRQAELPVKEKKTKVRDRFFHYTVLQSGTRLALKERTGRDIWSGMYDFWLTETDTPGGKPAGLPADLAARAEVSPVFTHILSHQKIQAVFHTVEVPVDFLLPEQLKWYTFEELEDLPKPVLILKYLKERYQF